MRPFIDSICGPSVVDAAAIGAHARAYIGEKHAAGSPFTVQADVKAWAQRYLHQLMLGIDLSEEDAQELWPSAGARGAAPRAPDAPPPTRAPNAPPPARPMPADARPRPATPGRTSWL